MKIKFDANLDFQKQPIKMGIGFIAPEKGE